MAKATGPLTRTGVPGVDPEGKDERAARLKIAVPEVDDEGLVTGELYCVDEHCPVLIQKAETAASIIELLLETLADLSDGELGNFKKVLSSQTDFRRQFKVPSMPFEITGHQDMVFLMVLRYNEEAVNETKEVLEKINRTDLVQRLSDSRSGPKKQDSGEHRSGLIRKIATRVAVQQLILETLNDLDDLMFQTFRSFMMVIVRQNSLSYFPFIPRHIYRINRRMTVYDMMENYGQQSVKFTREAFKQMKRTDLMQRLPKPSSGLTEQHFVDEHQPTLLLNDLKKILLETVKTLSEEELKKFKWLLKLTLFTKRVRHMDWETSHSTDLLVEQMVEICGLQSWEVTIDILRDMNRTDLVTGMSNSGFKEKMSVSLKLLETLEDFNNDELEEFKHVLQDSKMEKGLPRISRQRMELADKAGIVELMMETYGQQALEVTREVLTQMNRSDLVQRLPDVWSGSKDMSSQGPPGRMEPEGGGSVMKDCSDWTKVEPDVNSADADEAPTYSLQSDAGNFECSVSGLRWVCKEKVSLKYQFCSWEGHMERMEWMQYMPAGPLMDITVIAGKLFEVQLPHWICIDDNPEIWDKFAVLHIEDSGDVVEKASEVTSHHVKLSEPVFSPRAILMKVGFPVKILCDVLIYKINTAFLTLHVYLIPRDPGLQQQLDKRKLSYGHKIIPKPPPDESLKMQDRFILTADFHGAEVRPENIKLRYKSSIPSFFEVFIRNPDADFALKLQHSKELQTIWNHMIRKEEYQNTGHIQDIAGLTSSTPASGDHGRRSAGAAAVAGGGCTGAHFVDKHRLQLIKRVKNIEPIFDELLDRGIIQQESYDEILASRTDQEKMRKLYSGPLTAAGPDGKDVFYAILEEREKYLIADLKKKK